MGELTKFDVTKLTVKQIAVLQAAEDQGIAETLASICMTAEVSRQSFYEWRRNDPNFVAAWNALRERMLFSFRPGIDRAMIREAMAGNVAAARTCYELEQLGKIALPGKLLIDGQVQDADFTIIPKESA